MLVALRFNFEAILIYSVFMIPCFHPDILQNGYSNPMFMAGGLALRRRNQLHARPPHPHPWLHRAGRLGDSCGIRHCGYKVWRGLLRRGP